MANLTIRNFDDELKSLLRQQAARHGCSMEQEAREILRRAVQTQPTSTGFAQRIHRRFAGLKAGKSAHSEATARNVFNPCRRLKPSRRLHERPPFSEL